MDLTKYKQIIEQRDKTKTSEFWEKFRLIQKDFPNLLYLKGAENYKKERGMWFKYLSNTRLNFFDIEKLLKEASELDDKYNKIGFIFNKIKNNPKPKEYINTLFGLVEKKKIIKRKCKSVVKKGL